MKTWGTAVAVAALSVGVTACSSDAPTGAGGEWGSPGEPQAVYANVTYYPACGNEVLVFDGTSWYPIDVSQDSDFPAPRTFPLPQADAKADASALSDFVVERELTAVAPPGPGDDAGTLVMYEHGFAYWESDSGVIGRWLTSQQQEYNFVC